MEEEFKDRFNLDKKIKMKVIKLNQDHIIVKLICTQGLSNEWCFELMPEDYERFIKLIGTFEMNLNMEKGKEYSELLSIQDNNRMLKLQNNTLRKKQLEFEEKIKHKDIDQLNILKKVQDVLIDATQEILRYAREPIEKNEMIKCNKGFIEWLHIKDMYELDNRTRRILANNRVIFLKDLLRHSEWELQDLKGVGPKMVLQIQKFLNKAGLKLKGDK